MTITATSINLIGWGYDNLQYTIVPERSHSQGWVFAALQQDAVGIARAEPRGAGQPACALESNLDRTGNDSSGATPDLHPRSPQALTELGRYLKKQ